MSSKRESYRWARLMMTAASCGWAIGCVAGCGNGRYYRYGDASQPRTIAMVGDRPLSSIRGEAGEGYIDDGGGAADAPGSNSRSGSPTRLASASQTGSASVTGRVLNSRDLPVSDARIRLAGLNRKEVITDIYGRFEIKGLRPGQKYTLLADLEGETTQLNVVAPEDRVRLRLKYSDDGSPMDQGQEAYDGSGSGGRAGSGARTARAPESDEESSDSSESFGGARPRRASNPSSSTSDDSSLLDLNSGSDGSVRRYQDDSNGNGSDEDGRSDPYPPARKASSSSSSPSSMSPYSGPGASRTAPGWRSEANLDWGVKTQSWTRIKPGDNDLDPNPKADSTSGSSALKNQGAGQLLAANATSSPSADSSGWSRAATDTVSASDDDQRSGGTGSGSATSNEAGDLPDPSANPNDAAPSKSNSGDSADSKSEPRPRDSKVRWEDLNWPNELLEPRAPTSRASASVKSETAPKTERSVRQASNSASAPNAAARRSESVKRDGFATATCDYDSAMLRLRDFQLPDLGGQPVSFKNLQADYVLLDFWGTWCGPCNASIPHLVRLQKKYGPKKLQVVGVAYETTDDLKEAATRVGGAQRALAINYPLLLGRSGSCPLQSQLHVDMYPTLILLDRNGRVIWRDKGAKSSTLSRLDKVLAGVIDGKANRANRAATASTATPPVNAAVKPDAVKPDAIKPDQDRETRRVSGSSD